MSETGSVKFVCEHVIAELPVFAGFNQLNACRRKLLQMGVVGVNAGGIGFGNISVRDRATNNFYITGSGTGAKSGLETNDYARVVAFDVERNWIRCEGAVIASSESLTHAAIYDAAPAVRAVIHCHSAEQWRCLLDLAPTTSAAAEYGSPGMAKEVSRLFLETDVMKTWDLGDGGSSAWPGGFRRHPARGNECFTGSAAFYAVAGLKTRPP